MAQSPRSRGAQCGCIGLRPALDPTKMPGLTTDGAAAMVGKHNRFIKKFLEAFEAQSVVVNNCIIRQEMI